MNADEKKVLNCAVNGARMYTAIKLLRHMAKAADVTELAELLAGAELAAGAALAGHSLAAAPIRPALLDVAELLKGIEHQLLLRLQAVTNELLQLQVDAAQVTGMAAAALTQEAVMAAGRGQALNSLLTVATLASAILPN